MRRLFTLLLGIGLGGCAVYIGFNYHVLQTNDGLLFVPKVEADLQDPYCDVRQWGADDWRGHTKLTEAVVRYGRGDLVIRTSSQNLIDRVFDKLGRGGGK